jgi:hypothetical protein
MPLANMRSGRRIKHLGKKVKGTCPIPRLKVLKSVVEEIKSNLLASEQHLSTFFPGFILGFRKIQLGETRDHPMQQLVAEVTLPPITMRSSGREYAVPL